MIKNLIIGGIAIAFIAWVATACSPGEKKPRRGNKPVVAVSIPPQLFFLKAIAGDRVEAVCLLGNSADPESFEPSMGQLVDLERADAYWPIGELPFEKSLLPKLRANNSGLRIANMTQGMELLTGTHTHGRGESAHTHTVADPHVWSSARNARVMAGNMLNSLVEIDSINEDAYRANYQRLVNRLDSIDGHFARVFAAEDSPKSFLVWHPSLSYFARDYGLEQISLTDGGKEASVKGVIERLDNASTAGAPVCFYQKEFDSSRVASLARDLGVTITEINPMNEEWEDEMQKLYDAFTVNKNP